MKKKKEKKSEKKGTKEAMVAQSSRAGTVPPTSEATVVEPKLKDDEKPAPNVRKKEKKRGFLSMAKARASGAAGGLRKALIGGKTAKSARPHFAADAEDIGRVDEEEEEGDSSAYDTVRSLPAAGHYGRSRVGHHGSGTRLVAQMYAAATQPLHVSVEDAPRGSLTVPTQPSPVATTVLRLPRRRTQPMTAIALRSPRGPVAGQNLVGAVPFDVQQAFHSSNSFEQRECFFR